MKDFFARFKRRQVYNVAVGCAVLAWPFVQSVIQVALLFDVPRSAVRLILILLVFVGFPIAVGVAWTFDFAAVRHNRERFASAGSNPPRLPPADTKGVSSRQPADRLMLSTTSAQKPSD
jgi:hypothetical protein